MKKRQNRRQIVTNSERLLLILTALFVVGLFCVDLRTPTGIVVSAPGTVVSAPGTVVSAPGTVVSTADPDGQTVQTDELTPSDGRTVQTNEPTPSDGRTVQSNEPTPSDGRTVQNTSLININTADASELTQLPGIGPVLAQRIVDYRQTNGPYRTIAELMNVSGIGQGRFSAVAEQITVG